MVLDEAQAIVKFLQAKYGPPLAPETQVEELARL